MDLVHTYDTSNLAEYIFYIQLPSNMSLLNEYMCGLLNQEGPLCRKCTNGYGTADTHTFWNAVSAGNMVMDGSCTITWNSFQ